jgi:hypothetical protein
MSATQEQSFTIGEHVKLEDQWWLPVRFVESDTLHEEPTTNAVFIDHEKFVELRSAGGEVKFFVLSSSRTMAQRSSGPCRGIKPYFWKGN